MKRERKERGTETKPLTVEISGYATGTDRCLLTATLMMAQTAVSSNGKPVPQHNGCTPSLASLFSENVPKHKMTQNISQCHDTRCL